MRRLLASMLTALLLAAPLALASSHYLKVSPTHVRRGHNVRVFGSVAGGCSAGSTVTVTSFAFRGATSHSFAGVPALYITAGSGGLFSKTVKIRSSVAPGAYHVGGRCGGGNFGSTTLTVTS